jgi:hypothetical protein
VRSAILFLSGITRLEKAADKRYWTREDYQQYKHSTSCLIPFPPVLIRHMPMLVKAIFFFEWGIYSYPSGIHAEFVRLLCDCTATENTSSEKAKLTDNDK